MCNKHFRLINTQRPEKLTVSVGSNELDKQQDGRNRRELVVIRISCNEHKRDRVGMLASGEHRQ